MKHMLLSTLLAFSVSAAFAADKQTDKAMPICTAEHVPITLKTKDGKSHTTFVKKDHAKHFKNAKGIEATYPCGYQHSPGSCRE